MPPKAVNRIASSMEMQDTHPFTFSTLRLIDTPLSHLRNRTWPRRETVCNPRSIPTNLIQHADPELVREPLRNVVYPEHAIPPAASGGHFDNIVFGLPSREVPNVSGD